MHLLLGLKGACGRENEDFARNILAIGEGLTQHKNLAHVKVPGVNVLMKNQQLSAGGRIE
ncbi:hypothetical protein PSTG_00731 [Puccinia striiformis f. sp. tritici PST-78]|uniref:Uncharacterized protein n=1 Tax=Puccinia striiformis f. sp. tritici PST-78 TaxID=1165861 RepID=A0A0L0W3Z8_9BASI|nr:hypothetical protein PSTG_00731 [Puccinia striiformis f. sp. tritici PST-78]